MASYYCSFSNRIFICNVDNGSLKFMSGCGCAGVHTCEHVPEYKGHRSALILLLRNQPLGLPGISHWPGACQFAILTDLKK